MSEKWPGTEYIYQRCDRVSFFKGLAWHYTVVNKEDLKRQPILLLRFLRFVGLFLTEKICRLWLSLRYDWFRHRTHNGYALWNNLDTTPWLVETQPFIVLVKPSALF